MRACQRYFGGIQASHTLHVGDQFLSAGANDFKVSLFFFFFSPMVLDVVIEALYVCIAQSNKMTGPSSVYNLMDRQSS